MTVVVGNYYYFVTQRELATEESINFTSWNVIRFFASVPLALNDKVGVDKKHMSLRGGASSGAEESVNFISLYAIWW